MTELKSFVFFDLETTGLPQHGLNKTKITEISLIACLKDHLLESAVEVPRVLHKLSVCLNPYQLIHYGASEKTGLYNDLLEHERTFDQSLAEMVKLFLGRLQQPICLVAHNGDKFDFPLFRREFLRVKVELAATVYCMDSLPCFRTIDAIQERRESHSAGLDSEIPDLEYEAVNALEELEKAQKGLSEHQRLNERTPHRPGHLEHNFKASLRSYLNVTAGPALPEDGSRSDQPVRSRKRLFANVTAESPTTSKQSLGCSPLDTPKKRFRLQDVYRRCFREEIAQAHHAEGDVQALLKCAAAYGQEFVKYAESYCRPFTEVSSELIV